MKHYPTMRAPVRFDHDEAALNRSIVSLQRSTLLLLILTSAALAFCLTAWACAALIS